MADIGKTVRIIKLDKKPSVAWNDVIPFVDVDDTSGSVDGTDCSITIRDMFETAPVRSSADLSLVKPLSEWIGLFDQSIKDVLERTKKATTTNFGIVRYATDTETKAKVKGDRALSAKNLAALDATTSLAGLIALATAAEVGEGQVDNKAITPSTLFESILGDAVLSNNRWTFKLPVKNVVGDVKMELVVQVAQEDFVTMDTELNPQSNFNHIHQTIDVEVTYPEQFQNTCLMVIPIGIEATPSEYTEATDFWIRPFDVRRAGATLRATRINGVSNGEEEAAVRYLAIGY